MDVGAIPFPRRIEVGRKESIRPLLLVSFLEKERATQVVY